LVGIPLRMVFPPERINAWGLTSLRDERFSICQQYVSGRLLDIGCGVDNLFAREVENGIGVDAFPWRGVDVQCVAASLPFPSDTFDTVTIISTLNHIPMRLRALHEAFRVLRPGGSLLVTMINPVWGHIIHILISWWSWDMREREQQCGEVAGMWASEIERLLKMAGFEQLQRVRFLYECNNLFIGRKPVTALEQCLHD
jgi:SAM-dependent methyltransferase